MPEPFWPNIAVMGAGAVGCYFGGMLARAGAPVTLIGRARHVEAIRRDGLLFEGMQFQERVRLSASTEASAASGASLVLFCVKTFDTEHAARVLAPHLAPGAVVLSLQNGVDNVERIRAATSVDAIAGVVYVAAEMAGPGHLKHNGRGDLIIGNLPAGANAAAAPADRLSTIASLFERAGVLCRVVDDIQAELWRKMIINCAYNAISALGRARYARLAANPWTREIIVRTIEESAAVARAAGVRLEEAGMVQAGLEIAQSLASATSSMAQDLARGARTEIDSLNGYIVRRGRECGVATPINQTLYALIKLLEEESSAERRSRNQTPHPPSFLGHPLPEGEGRVAGSCSCPLPAGEGGERSEPGEGGPVKHFGSE